MSLLAPEGFDARAHQFVKGEHLGDFPYLYLDYPKFFSHQEKFTFRTLFWWGHYFVFSWILQGIRLGQYRENLFSNYTHLADAGLYILTTENLWEWRKTPEYVIEIRSDNRDRIEATLENPPFLKLHCYLQFNHPSMLEKGLEKKALDAFRLMRPIVAKA